MVPSVSGARLHGLSLQRLTDTGKPSPHWHLTKLARDSRLARRTRTSSFGMLWEKLGYTGMSCHLTVHLFLFIIIWVCRLRGHRDQVTAIRFVRPTAESGPSTSTGNASGFLLSGSKDTFLKLWDLPTQHCIQTIVAHRSEIWTMDLNPQQNLLFTGSGEGEMKAWKIDHGALAQGLRETESGEVGSILYDGRLLVTLR